MVYSGLVGAVILALDIFALYTLWTGGGSMDHKVLWTVLIVLLPVVGMVLYFLIGRKPGAV